jgi:hypothetical protein
MFVSLLFTGSLKLLASLLQRRGFLYATVLLKPALASSFITATLGMNGWLGFVQQGLSPAETPSFRLVHNG